MPVAVAYLVLVRSMRTFNAILVGCAVMLVTFSVPWSLLVVSHHSYGGDSRFGQILGTIIYFGIYLLPLSIALALACVWPTARLIRERLSFGQRAFALGALWTFIASAVYFGAVLGAGAGHLLGAACCTLAAAFTSSLVYSWLKT